MSGTKGLILGLMIGLVIATAGVVTTMVVLGSRTVHKQAEAYDEGMKKGLDMATGNSVNMGDTFNKGLMDDNETLKNELESARIKLEALLGRDDLTPQAKDDINMILTELK